MIPIGKTAFIGFIVATATCLGMSASGSEKNGKTLTAEESLMRSDTRIMELDGMLNHSYRAAMRAVADRKTLKQAQIAWLRTVRNPCKTTDCLEDVYCDRINELHDLEIEALGVIDKPLTDDEVKSIFQTLAKLADKGELSLMAVPGKAFSRLNQADKRAGWDIDPVKLKINADYYGCVDPENSAPYEVFKLRLNPKAEPVIFGKFWNSASCPSANVYDLSTNVDLLITQESNDAQNEEDSEETAESFDGDDRTDAYNWAYYGGSDYPIVYRGRYFMVTSDIRNKNRLRQIDWPTRGLFLSADSHKAVISTDYEALSSCVVTGKIKPMCFKPFKVGTQLKKQLREPINDWFNRFGYSWMDIDGNGVLENVGLFFRRHLEAVEVTPCPG